MSTVDIKTVKAQADKLGITYHHRAGAEKIAGLIAAHLSENPADAIKLAPEPEPQVVETLMTEVDAASEDPNYVPTRAAGDPCPVTPMKQHEYMAATEADRVHKMKRLHRVRIQCMNPMKREWPGEIVSVGSAKYGTMKKFIPFDGEPYHIPGIIYDFLKERQCTLFRTVKDERGQDKREGYLANEFAIEDLPQLTPKEIEEMRKKQQLASIGM